MEKININRADSNELCKIVHIGKARALYIIRKRPFRDLHELSIIPYLGEKRMLDILNQGLASVK